MRIFLDDPNAIKQLVQTVSTAPTTSASSILLPNFFPPAPPSSLPASLLSNSSLLTSATSNGFHASNLLARDHAIESQSNILFNESPQLAGNETAPVPSSLSPLSSNGLANTALKSKSRSKNSKANHDKVSSNQSRHSSANPLMTPYELPKIPLPGKLA